MLPPLSVVVIDTVLLPLVISIPSLPILVVTPSVPVLNSVPFSVNVTFVFLASSVPSLSIELIFFKSLLSSKLIFPSSSAFDVMLSVFLKVNPFSRLTFLAISSFALYPIVCDNIFFVVITVSPLIVIFLLLPSVVCFISLSPILTELNSGLSLNANEIVLLSPSFVILVFIFFPR